MFIKEFAKRLSSWVCDTLYHCVQCHLSSTDRPHAVMYPPRAEAPLDDLLRVSRRSRERWPSHSDLESSAPAKNQVSQRHADIVVDDLRVALRCVIEPHDHHLTNNFDAGSISWDDHDALLFVRVGVIRVTLPQNKVDFCPRVPCATDVPGKWKGCVTWPNCQRRKEKSRTNHLCPLMTI